MKKYREKWKRSFAILLGITLLMGQIELPVYAETSSEESASGSGSMSTDIMTVSGNTLDNGVPGTVSGNDIIPVTSDAGKEVQDFIDALPTVEAVKAMNSEDRNAAYTLAQEVYELYETLTEEEQSQVDTTKVEALFAYFNGMVSLAAEAGPFTITQNGSSAEANKDYTWDDTTKMLTINTRGLTVANATPETNASALIKIDDSLTDATLTLAGVNITAPDNNSALSTAGQLTITLAEGSTNTLTGGTSSSTSSYGIWAAGALSISGGGTLHADGGAVSNSYSYSVGISSDTSITIEGGTVESVGGSSNRASYGIFASSGYSDKRPTITINGGTVEATGNTGGIHGAFSTGTEGKAIIHTSSISDKTNEGSWKGIIFEGRGASVTGYDGKVYGDQTLGENFTHKAGEVLEIPADTTLTLDQGVTLTNEGILRNYGTIDATKGTFTQNGSLNNEGKIIRSDGVEVGPFLVKDGDPDRDYTWDHAGKTLTINTETALTISTPKNTANGLAPACITAKATTEGTQTTYGDLNLTLNGVHITAQDGGSALGSDNFNTSALKGGAVNLTLQGSNTLTGGNTTNKSSLGICTKGALTINGTGSLTATGGTVSANDTVRASAGIYSETSIIITSGEITATGGSSSGSSFGIYASSTAGNNQPKITISGGTVTATGGQATTASCGMSATGAITINGDSVEATGGTLTGTGENRQSYGICSTQSTISITSGTGTATTTGTSATNKGAMNKAPDFTKDASVGSKQANTDTTMSWGLLPTITTNPVNATVNAGETAAFTVAATGGALTYQWQSSANGTVWDKVSDGTGVSGAATVALSLTDTTMDMNGNQYRCVVDNEYGSATSEAVTLTVNPKDQTAPAKPSIASHTKDSVTLAKVLSLGTPVEYKIDGGAWQTSPTFTGLTDGTSYSFVVRYAATENYNASPDSEPLVTEIPHSYTGSVTKEPTCSATGTRTYTCSCGDSYTESIDALGHTAGDWIVDKEATQDAEGSRHKECTVCHTALETESIDKLPPKPFIKGEDGKEGWPVITDKTEVAEPGDKVTVDMNGSITVPGDVIESIAGKDVTIVFDMGNGIKWSVNGTTVTGDDIADIDFDVVVGGEDIPVDVINKVTGERYSMGISIGHDGDFGFTAVLTINMDKKNAGLYANLFYYNEANNALEYICADEIDAEGNTDLTFTHASDYTIVIDKAPMDDTEDKQKPSGGHQSSSSDKGKEESSQAVSPSTGDAAAIWQAIIVLLTGVATVIYGMRRKPNRTNK